jgi:chromosome segregation ATPase
MVIFPRQARDKHRENSLKKERRFCRDAASLRQSRSEIVAAEEARSHLEAELAHERAWREERQAMDERQRHAAGGGGGSDGGLSRQLAAAKLLAKDSSRQLEMAQDELAVAQAEKTTLTSQLSAASRDVAAAEGKLGAAQDRASRALQGQTQLVASYDRLLAAFSAKCASLRMGQESSALAHEQFREKLTVRSSYIPVPYGHGTCHAN